MKNNLHTHTSFSDGSDRPEKYVAEALRQDFGILGFSDHSPVPFENSFAIRDDGSSIKDYCTEITRLKHLHNDGGKLEVLLGLEVDYIPGFTKSLDEYRRDFNFDYFIGSVHLVKNVDTARLWFIDGPAVAKYDEGLRSIFGNDIRKAVTSYFSQIREMVHKEKPDVVGHLDKIKMHNRGRFFSESDPWYIEQVEETLDVIKYAGSVIEVNTRGIYKKRSDSLYPGSDVLGKILKMKIPVTISSDAHRPGELSSYFPETIGILRDIGFRGQWILESGEWKEIPFTR